MLSDTIIKTALTAASLPLLMAGCSSARTSQPEKARETPAQVAVVHGDGSPVLSSRPRALPKAIIYRTSGNYLENVPVRLSPDGTLLSYPAPTDIPEKAAPERLAGGWLLSPIGIDRSTVFTRYTYPEYRALAQAPSQAELLEAVIPGAKVTATLEIPMTLSEAMADTAAVNRLIPTVGNP